MINKKLGSRVLKLVVAALFFEFLGYRQLNVYWRFKGLWRYIRGDEGWDPLQRKGLKMN